MVKHNENNEAELTIKVPQTLSLKDLITIVSIAISLTIAWGVFSTRIAVLEKEVVTLQGTAREQKEEIQALTKRQQVLTAIQRDNVMIIDQLFGIMKKPAPSRRPLDN